MLRSFMAYSLSASLAGKSFASAGDGPVKMQKSNGTFSPLMTAARSSAKNFSTVAPVWIFTPRRRISFSSKAMTVLKPPRKQPSFSPLLPERELARMWMRAQNHAIETLLKWRSNLPLSSGVQMFSIALCPQARVIHACAVWRVKPRQFF